MRESGAGAAGVVCASAGNFGQGLAYAARAAAIPCHVFVGRSANPGKVEAMSRLGASVEVGGDDYDASIETARSFAESAGLRFVQDGRDPWIAAGAATMARELTEAGGAPEVALVPVGNSALILGVAVWLRHVAAWGARRRGLRRGAPAPALSWRAREPVASGRVDTVADGIGIREPFAESVAGMLELVDDMVLVSEAAARRGGRLAATTGLLVEAAGAASVAALLDDPGELPRRERLHAAVRRQPAAGRARLGGRLAGLTARAPARPRAAGASSSRMKTGAPSGTIRISRRRSRSLACMQPSDGRAPIVSGDCVPWTAIRSRPFQVSGRSGWWAESAIAQQP